MTSSDDHHRLPVRPQRESSRGFPPRGNCQARGTDHAIITAHPHDLSGGKVQANIKKVVSSPVYRVVVDADEEAQKLALTRGKMLGAAIKMGAAGLPAREVTPEKTDVPCGYCEWKTRCSVIEKDNFGMVLPSIPKSWSIKPDISEAAAA